MSNLLIALFVCILLHLLAIAAAGRAVGVTLRVFSLGFGPALIRGRVWRLSLIPAGGYVKFRDSREEEVPAVEMATALDGRSTAEQVAISLAGCTALLLLAAGLLGQEGLMACWRGFWQIVAGALSPWDEAQRLLGAAAAMLKTAPFAEVLGLAAAKLAALNLLPLPAFNGGAALAVLGRRVGAGRFWPAGAHVALLWLCLGLLASWVLALGVYLLHA